VLDAVKAGVLVFTAAILQASVFADVDILGGTPDLLLVVLVCVALLRGSVYGAVCGFFGGLILDIADLGALGITSLLLTLLGYWIGRYGETTGRGRSRAVYLVVPLATFLYALGGLFVHAILGQPAPARAVLLDSLFQGIVLNLILTWPVYRLGRLLFRSRDRSERVPVQIIG
jgi:rod shape-determining protein MreD